MDNQVYAGVDEDDNGYDDADDGNLDEDQTEGSGSANPSDTDDSDDPDDTYLNTAGKILGQPALKPVEDEHRAALGSLVQNLQDRGIDVDSLAQEAGLSGADVDNLQHDDVVTLSQYLAQSHPEVTQQVFSRFPLAQGLVGRLLGQ